MRRRRLVLGALAFTSCSPTAAPQQPGDGGTADAGSDAGTDAGTDAGYDAGRHDPTLDSGCRCASLRSDGGCPMPNDFPADAGSHEVPDVVTAVCECQPNADVYCYDETSLRCSDLGCNPGKALDGGVKLLLDGGIDCLC
jgi:hypothetical protein